jgi:DNA repair protein SbcD/Mre11
MRCVHLADCHLGHRGYGKDERVADVQASFDRAVTQIIALRPDLVVVAGDFFDSPRPANAVLVDAHASMRRLTSALPGVPICICSGNHELSRNVEVPTMLRLFQHLGVTIAERGPVQVRFGDVAVTLSPDPLGEPRVMLEPDASARKNVLVLHGRLPVEGQRHYTPEMSAESVSEWDVACLGDFHSMHQVGPRAWYAGSLELVDSNPWNELDTAHGFLEHDLDAGTTTFHKVARSRPFIDLPPIGALGKTPDEVNTEIRDRLESVVIDGAVVRLRVYDLELSVKHALDWTMIRKAKGRALHFLLDTIRPEVTQVIGQSTVKPAAYSQSERMERGLLRLAHKAGYSVPEYRAIEVRYLAAGGTRVGLYRSLKHSVDRGAFLESQAQRFAA